MKYVALVGILAAFSLLTGCRSTSTPQSATTQSPIDTVRNGYLKYNQTTTIGKALAGTFSNGTWKSFATNKGVTIVEFDGSEPFSEFRSTLALTGGHMGSNECSENLICAALDKKFSDYCDSAAGQDQPTRDYQKELDTLGTKLDDVRKQEKVLSSQSPRDFDSQHELSNEETSLQSQIISLHKPDNSCFDNTYKQHANDPIPVVVQFSINQDGTFQYEANDMGLSVEVLFKKIYK